MITPDRKVRKLMEEYQKTGNVSNAAMRADLDPKTARKYLRSGKLPSQMKAEHTWRTREDPFEDHWDEAERMLEAAVWSKNPSGRRGTGIGNVCREIQAGTGC